MTARFRSPRVGTITECAEGGISIELLNGGDDAADFTVNQVTVSVGAHSTVIHLVIAQEDETLTVTIKVGAEELYYGSITRDCAETVIVPPPPPPPPSDPPTTPPPPATTTPPPASPPQAVRLRSSTPTATPTPAPTPVANAAPQLAMTGASSTDLLPPAVALVFLGGLLVIGSRRLRRA